MTTEFEGRLPESEETLRQMYGEDAVFSRVGGFTLVHLDRPSEEQIARRVREFDPEEFFFDDCPLCQMAMRDGGHVVFDGHEDPDGEDDEPESAGPVGEFTASVAALAAVTGAFGDRLRGKVPEETERRYYDQVHGLSDRIVEVLWGEECPRRVELFDDIIARATEVVDEVGASAPALAAEADAVRRSLLALADAWAQL